MSARYGHNCQICGAEKLPGDEWLLVAPDRLLGLVVVAWDEASACGPDVYPVCSRSHALAVVSAWVITGCFPLHRAADDEDDLIESEATDDFLDPVQRQHEDSLALFDAIQGTLEEELRLAHARGQQVVFDA